MHLGSIFLPLLFVVLCPACRGTDQPHQQSAAQQVDTSLATARYPGGATRSRILISLRDGSQLMGTADGTPIPFQTAYGELSVALEQARSLVVEDSIGTSTLNFHNGDLLHGRVTLKAVHIEGTLGPMDIPLAAITRIMFIGTGSNVTEGLFAHYPLDGSTADATGHRHDGTNHGATPTQDRFGNPDHAYLFNGSGAYIALPDGMLDPLGSAFTITAWAMARSMSGERFIVHIGANTSEVSLTLKDQQFRFLISLSSHGGRMVTGPAELNNFVHLVCVYKRGQAMSLWVNGQQAGETSLPDDGLAHGGNDHSSTIGSYAPEQQNHSQAYHLWTWDGIIDDVRIYSRALEPAEITALAMEKP